MSSRHNKYVSVTDWFAPPPSSKGTTTTSLATGIAASGANFAGGSWGQGGSGGGLTIQIIKTNDTTPASNSNVYSALRVHNSYISKDKDERTSGKLSSDVGFEVGEFVSGASGAICYIDPETLQTTAELDRLKVRIKAYFETLEIVNVNSVGGKQIISPAGAITCAKVEVKGPITETIHVTDDEGNPLYDEDGNPITETIIVSEDNGIPEDTYRCYFLAELDGDKVGNRWHVGDQAYCQTFNAFDGEQSQVSNTYYWRLVTGVTTNPVEIDGKQWHYIDLSISDCDTNSDVPKEGDVICHRGSRTENDRRNLLEFSAVDTFSPNITLYQGVGVLDEEKGLYPYSLANKDIISYGVNKTSNKAFMNVYGDMYVGDREGNSFIRFDEVGGLTIKGNLSAGTTLGDSDLTLEQRIEAASQAYKEDINAFKDAVIKSFNDVQNQIDGAIETYFLDPVPTLDNEPAVQWNTDEIKASHVGDLYYSAEGNAYRFQYTTITNEDGSISNSYYWNKINDTDIVTALANAKRALDTADSKRKIFVQQPKTNESYEIGDMWANATYIDPITNLVIYESDLLRAVTIKLQGQAFSIDHWELASKYTDDSAAIAAMEAAKNAQNTADKAQADATAASNRLNSWAADGVISPTEKKGIKEEYARALADNDHINNEYEKYFLGTPTDYNNAYLSYITALIGLFTSELEIVPIPNNFETLQTTYYTARTNALNVISSAAKKVADDAQVAADNAREEAEKALTSAEEAKEVVYDMNLAVTGSAEYVREAFADGIINKGERATIENYVHQIDTVSAQVEESYKEVVSNQLLVGSNELENLKTSYATFVNATAELKNSISDISKMESVANINKATFENKYNNFNAAYSTYTQWLNAASKYVEYALNSRVDATIEALGGYSYLKNALNNEKTTVTGGLVLTTMLALGYTDTNQEYHINAGINGAASKNDDIVLWAGGSNIDKFVEPDNTQAADFLVRGDGTGYAAGGNFWWDSSGTIHADPMSFVISELSVGMLLASFQVYYDWNTSTSKYEPYAIDPKIPFTTLQISSDLVLGDSGILHFGDAELGYDATNNAVYLRSKDGNPINFYTTGGISMYGLGNTSVATIMDGILYDDATLGINSNGELYVKGSIGSSTTLGSLSNVGAWADSVADVDRIMYQAAGSSSWVAKSLSSIGSGGGLDITALQNYLTQNSYLNVTSGDNRYLKLSGGTINGELFINNSNNAITINNGYLSYQGGTNWRVTDYGWGKSYAILHEGNYSNYALPLSGGEISGTGLMPLTINTSNSGIEILLKCKSNTKVHVGWSMSDGVFMQEGESEAYIGVQPNKTPYYFNGTRYTLWHEGNFTPSNYLPLSGGTLDGVLTLRASNSYSDSWIEFSNKGNSVVHKLGVRRPESTYGLQYYNGSEYYNILHEGNYSNYALPLTGGTVSGNIQLGNDNNTSYYAMLVKQNGNVMSVGLDYGYGTLGYRESGTTNWNLLSVKNNDILCSFNGGNNWNTLIHSGNIGEYTIRYYGNQGAIDFDNVLYNGVQYTSGSSVNGGKHYGALMSLWAGDTAWQIVGGRANEGLMYRSGNGTSTSWTAWKTIAFTDSNVASATKLQTARTIWGQSFDGTSDVNGNILLGVGSDYVIGTGYSSSDKRTFNNITIGNSTTGIVYNGGTWTSSPSFNAHTFITGASSNALVINNSGNVGIGTTSPSSLLHVNGDGRITDIHFRGSYINLNRDGATSAIYDSTKTALEIEATQGVSILRTYNVTRQASIVLHTNGNIGIGTLSPSTKLHVAGNFRTNDVWIGSDTGTYIEGTQTGGLRIQYANSENKYTQIHLKDLTVTINNNLLCSGGITMYSDQRKKTILSHVELSLKQIANAPLVEHYYNSDEKKTTHVGSIAQYWASMNDWFCKLDSEGYYTMEIQNAALASAISIARELDRYETKTDKDIKKLKKRICELEEEVERLKSA